MAGGDREWAGIDVRRVVAVVRRLGGDTHFVVDVVYWILTLYLMKSLLMKSLLMKSLLRYLMMNRSRGHRSEATEWRGV